MAEFVANYDEDKVPDYTLPDPLIFEDGTEVGDTVSWQRRRAEILSLFESQVYGKMPGAVGMHFETRFLNGDELKGICKEVRVYFVKDAEEPRMDILIFLPRDADGPVPLFVGLNFGGNHTVRADLEIALSRAVDALEDGGGFGSSGNGSGARYGCKQVACGEDFGKGVRPGYDLLRRSGSGL